jgi:hypothetical protein
MMQDFRTLLEDLDKLLESEDTPIRIQLVDYTDRAEVRCDVEYVKESTLKLTDCYKAIQAAMPAATDYAGLQARNDQSNQYLTKFENDLDVVKKKYELQFETDFRSFLYFT